MYKYNRLYSLESIGAVTAAARKRDEATVWVLGFCSNSCQFFFLGYLLLLRLIKKRRCIKVKRNSEELCEKRIKDKEQLAEIRAESEVWGITLFLLVECWAILTRLDLPEYDMVNRPKNMRLFKLYLYILLGLVLKQPNLNAYNISFLLKEG
jgi:hypothetical protein